MNTDWTKASVHDALPPTLERDLEGVLNRYSQENGSNTPDFILAQYLLDCLAAFNACSRAREAWYGRSLSINGSASDGGSGVTPVDPRSEPIS